MPVTAAGVFVVVTVRGRVIAPDAIDSLAGRDGGARRHGPVPLGDELDRRAGGGGARRPVGQSVVRRVVDTSAGNALYARQLVTGALEDGRLDLRRVRPVAAAPLGGEPLAGGARGQPGGWACWENAGAPPGAVSALGEPLRLSEMPALSYLDTSRISQARRMVTIDPG